MRNVLLDVKFVLEIPPNENGQCVSYHDPYYFHAKILINGKLINDIWVRDEDPTETQETRMWLKCIPLSDLNPQGKGRKTPMQQGNTNTYRFQVIFNFPDPDGGPIGFKSWGVHLLGHQVQVDDDDTTTMNESTTSVGKKRPRGSEEEQWLCSSSSEPTDQPKQRHIDIDEDQKYVN
ncbi:unnamed protein product [Prunus armeniaca]|uniref:Uncharacterized protein n=1 Tax=Prunus armeniaca TaxID=36596 RepID=A0A6J5U1W6_PRUAR|nr:unnamed protein product [Prunus armeniaca]